MALIKSEEFAKRIIELADEKAVTWNEFMYGLRLAKEITKRSRVGRQCLAGYKFPSEVEPPEVNGLFQD